jgi:serine phosphatase RsbU (regulator of sigma subunit)
VAFLFVLGLVAIVPVAFASHGHVGGQGASNTPIAPAPYGGSGEAPPAEAPQPCCVATAAAPPVVAEPSSPPAQRGASASKSRHGHASSRSEGHKASGGGQSKHAGSGSGPAQGQGAASGKGKGGNANSGGTGRGHAKVRHGAQRGSKQALTTPEVTAPSTTSSGAGSTTVSNLPQAVVGSPSATVPASTPAPAAPAHTSSGSVGTAHRAHHARSGRRAHHVAAPAAGAALVAAGKGAGTAGFTAPATRPGSPKTAAHRAAPNGHSSESPIVRSVTKIIDVVPPLMRVLIGVLIALALLLGAMSRFTALRARRLARQRAELLDDVGLLQAALLPPLPAQLGPVGTSAAYRPASGPGAGGDFYDVFALPDGELAVIVGDVSGHGRDALPQTTLVRFTLRAYLEAGLSPRAALASAARVLERQLGGAFATVVLATYDPRQRKLVYASAGHPPPLVVGAESIAPITACAAPPIGIGHATGTRQTTVAIPGAAVACFYTDGVVEARTHGTLFGAGRLEHELAEVGPDAGAAELLERVSEATDHHPDDMAACLLRIEGSDAAPSVCVEEFELSARDLERDRAERFLLAGGVHPSATGRVLDELRDSVGRYGRVVLELHVGPSDTQVTVRPHNVTTLEPSIRAAASAQGAIS